jgi:hypothetical protein
VVIGFSKFCLVVSRLVVAVIIRFDDIVCVTVKIVLDIVGIIVVLSIKVVVTVKTDDVISVVSLVAVIADVIIFSANVEFIDFVE